ncbi:Bifunctional aspartokinase/homoserine dehydrogenase 1, chloroplastic [Trifolium repens]|nr:Bifunctional aspartokinase/homoserine dehydrogenase 1, chloroplastic [Trifolium repens]
MHGFRRRRHRSSSTQYLKLRALQRQSYTHYFYEATVGAGLPIVSTLRGLLETGDKILQIEGIFSGTLSYIFNNFKDGRAFSEVVGEAKEAGFIEPDPRDDLSGTDVARKVIILARESGLKLELSNIPVESLVPEPLRACASAQEFMQQLPKFDPEFAKKQEDADNAGEVLRYVGVVDVTNQKGVVELRRYKKDHPFAQLSGSDNIIAFTTRRYKNQPLIVRGPGAGAQVTACGIFSDILRLASYLDFEGMLDMKIQDLDIVEELRIKRADKHEIVKFRDLKIAILSENIVVRCLGSTLLW